MKVQRTLPPSAAPIDWSDIFLSLEGLIRPESVVRQREAEFREYFGVKYVWFVSSGKAALTLILQALHKLSGRQKVILPGYTCFSVPSAVVKAKLDVTLCDVEPGSFDLDFHRLHEIADRSVLCVLSTHLLGIQADVSRIAALCRTKDIFVVEDAAQAFGGDADGKPIGTLGDVSFLSFGRGKNISCGSGGAILSNDDRIGAAISHEYARLPEESVLGIAKNWLEVMATQLMIHPSIYWLPAGLPFLKLGETKFYWDFPITKMDSVRAGLLRGWKDRLALVTMVRRAHAQQIQQSLEASPIQVLSPTGQGRSVYLRFPVLMQTKAEKEALCRMSVEQGLGITSAYPSSLQDIEELHDTVSCQPVPRSTVLAERLVTFPTHEFLREPDIQRIRRAIEQVHYIQDHGAASSSFGRKEHLAGQDIHGINRVS